MRRRTIGIVAISALALSACGSTFSGATTPRPPAPVNVTVYINNRRVSISPSSVGAGPVTFIVTNQAGQAESLVILASGPSAGKPLAKTGPINPQATAQVTVDFFSQGTYSLSTSTDTGAGASPSTIRAASIHVGRPRSNSDKQLLQP